MRTPQGRRGRRVALVVAIHARRPWSRQRNAPDDDDTASEDMEDYAREAVREVEERERQHRAAYGGGSDARSVMAQCGSDSGDRSDPEATQGDM